MNLRPQTVHKIRLLLVDDHEVVRLGLRALFSRSAGIEVVGEAGTAAQAVAEVGRTKPEVVLMDLRLGRGSGSGLEACRDILAGHPSVRVLFLTAFPDDQAVVATVLAGASGYLLKEIDPQALVRAVTAVAAGGSILDPVVTRTVIDQLQKLEIRSRHQRKYDISAQESRILALVVKGKTNKEIALALSLSDKTVKNYLSNAFQKLNVSRRSEAAAIFARAMDDAARDGAKPG